jgi:MSHA biogenesis protein MshO
MHQEPEIRFLRRASRGFTLVEMIVSIVLAGIIIGMVGVFGRAQLEAYIDVSNRAELTEAADTALRRISRELESALPNSVRVSGDGNFLEYVPIRDAGRYRADFGGGANDDPLDFGSNTDDRFDVLGPNVTIRQGDQLAIFNLGQDGSDVYAGTSRRPAIPGVALNNVRFTPGGTQFPLASPQNRFQIVGGPVTYECSVAQGTLVRHWCYNFQAVQPSVFGALPVHAACPNVQAAVLVNNVQRCQFSYAPAVQQRNGLVVLRLTLGRNGEAVQLMHQVHVLNTP